MSVIDYTSESVVTPERTFLYHFDGVSKKTIPVTVAIAPFIIDSDAEGIYAPNGFIPPGTPLALDGGSGSYDDFYVPWLPNISVDNGEATWLVTLFDPIILNRNSAGTIKEGFVTVAAIPGPAEIFVRTSKFPAYNDHTAYAGGAGSTTAVVTGDLPAGMIDVETFGISGLGGH